jgi:hypothetical protein
MLNDLVGQVMHIHDGLADASARELVQHVVEQRLTGDADQRLRHMVGQGAHAHTETGGKNHGFGGRNGHFLEFLSNPSNRAADHTTPIRLLQ